MGTKHYLGNYGSKKQRVETFMHVIVANNCSNCFVSYAELKNFQGKSNCKVKYGGKTDKII